MISVLLGIFVVGAIIGALFDLDNHPKWGARKW